MGSGRQAATAATWTTETEGTGDSNRGEQIGKRLLSASTLVAVVGNRKKRRGVTTANGGSARGKGGMELQATIDRSRRSIPFFNCDVFDCSTQIVNLVTFRNNFFLKDFFDRAAGRQGPDVFARLEAAEKRLEATRAAREKTQQRIADELALLRAISASDDDDVLRYDF